MAKKKVEIKQTIEYYPRVQCWQAFGISTAKPYRLSKFFRIKKLRGAMVYLVGPDSWNNSIVVNGKEIHARNKKLKVKIALLGSKSKKWKVDDTLVVKPRELVKVF